MNQNFKSYQTLTPGKQVVELRKLANEFGAQPSDVDTFLADLVNSYDCRPGFADAVLKTFEKAWKQADLKGMEMFMNLFRVFTGLEFSDFLNSAYMVATIRAEEHVAEDPQAWACVGKSRAIDQKDGCFSSHWKSGFTAISPCRVDVRTRQVISIVPFDGSCGKDVWWSADYETVKVDGEQHNVRNIDIITDRYAPADVCRELLAMEKAGEYWYSAFGLDFYEELIKAHEAMQIVPESEGWQSGFILSENRVLDEYRNRPDRPFLLANFEAYVPAELSRDGKGAVWQIDVWAEGRIHTSGDKSFPVAKLSVKAYMGNNTPVEFLYPFECDGSGEALRAEKGESGFSGKERLLHYLRFAEKIV